MSEVPPNVSFAFLFGSLVVVIWLQAMVRFVPYQTTKTPEVIGGKTLDYVLHLHAAFLC